MIGYLSERKLGGRGEGGVRLKLDVEGQGTGRILDVDGQGWWGVLKIGQYSWTSYMYYPLSYYTKAILTSLMPEFWQ